MILFEKKYQTFDTVFHHQMKHLEIRQKYSAARRIFNSLLGVSSGDETLHLMFDILLDFSLEWLDEWWSPHCLCFDDLIIQQGLDIIDRGQDMSASLTVRDHDELNLKAKKSETR